MNYKNTKEFVKTLRYYILRIWSALISPFYQRWIIPHKVRKIRRKNIIKVLFVLNELGSWKSENLYQLMLQHPRFDPQILILPEISAPYAYDILKEYLEKKKYVYNDIPPTETIKEKFHPDIIFYQKPYGNIPKQYLHVFNLYALFCLVPYCFRNRNIPNVKNSFIPFVWQNYAENETILREKGYPRNMIATGIPFMDVLLKNKSSFPDPWNGIHNKKRIIYAPHHTISTESFKSTSPFDYSTFLEYADFMLEMAIKYKQQVQWAFKPHPLLKYKLYKVWGKEKTDRYYDEWNHMENCQLDEGEYLGLFKHSDAMIHDCGSFKLEYLYTNNPVMYLLKEEQEFDYPNWQTREALNLHYKGYNKDDIENFVINVIKEYDNLKGKRQGFVLNYLTPPYGKTACDNIINAILTN